MSIRQPKKKAEAHLAQGEAEEDQPMLLMTGASTAVEVNAQSSTSFLASASLPPTTGFVDIKEEKVFDQLGPRADREPDRWVLDSGATNHMTGARGAFAKLDHGIHGPVRFGDARRSGHHHLQLQEWETLPPHRGALHPATHG
jgi:hypothetical protein